MLLACLHAACWWCQNPRVCLRQGNGDMNFMNANENILVTTIGDKHERAIANRAPERVIKIRRDNWQMRLICNWTRQLTIGNVKCYWLTVVMSTFIEMVGKYSSGKTNSLFHVHTAHSNSKYKIFWTRLALFCPVVALASIAQLCLMLIQICHVACYVTWLLSILFKAVRKC
jgi:hypothetical protein